MKIPPATIALGAVALLLLIFIIGNVLFSDTLIWVFGGYVRIATGWVVLITTLLGVGLGWTFARGRTPKPPRQ
jgi:hypothetical protein